MANSELSADVSPDQHFEPTESLYRRIPRADVEARAISDASIPSPAFSVDRGKYVISPAELLREYPDQGLARFFVGDIPNSLQSDQGDRYEFGVEHRPEERHFSHAEVHSYKGRSRLDDIGKEPPRHVRKKFRDLLRQKMEILNAIEMARADSEEPG